MKYLIVVVNSILKLAIGITGMLFAVNILMAGLLFYPNIALMVGDALGSNHSWSEWNLCPGLIPAFYLLSVISITIMALFKTIQLIDRADITKIIGKWKSPELTKLKNDMKGAYCSGRATLQINNKKGGKK